MGNDLTSSNNDFLKQLGQTVMSDSWLTKMYGSQRSEQQSELKKIFTVVSENNITNGERKALESRKEVLEDKVERLEAKMAVLEEEIAENSDKIKEKSNEITSLITSIQGKSSQLEEDHKRKVKQAVDDTFDMYKRGIIGKDAISAEIRTRIRSIDSESAPVQALIDQLDSKQSEISALITDATRWIDQKNILQNQYGATKSTYDLINQTLSRVGATEANYTNSDYDTKIPVYSLEKTDIISDISENAKINVQPTNSAYKEGSTKPTMASIKEKYEKFFSTNAKGELKSGKKYYLCSTDNKSVTKLQKAIDKGLLNDLASLGLSPDELKKFFADNFKGTQIKLAQDGTLNIPKGHAAKDGTRKAAATYNAVADFINNPTYYGAKNTWDKNAGNTISSNNQIKSLSENYESILDKLGKQEPKFTFKEAMYALFGSPNAIFKNAGINYDITKQGKNPTYSITPAGDAATAKMYKDLAAKIEEIWGIKPENATASRVDDDTQQDGEEETKRTDPLTFNLGDKDTEYAFVIDRNNNDAFNEGEFVGASSQSWLDDLKSLDKDGDGKLTGDELKELKIVGLSYKDNAATQQADGKFLRQETTNIEYSVSNALSMGIEEIDLSGLESQVNQSTGKQDVNGSEIFQDSFKFKIGGKEVTASRKDDTASFMNSVYSAVYGKNFNISMTEEDIQGIMDEDYGEFDAFAEKYQDVESDLAVLKNAANMQTEVENMFQKTLTRVADDESAQLTRADNKAASFTNNMNGWYEKQQEILAAAEEKGVDIDMEQAKGMYAMDASLSGDEIVSRYQQMLDKEEQISAERQKDKQAWEVLVECSKAGVKASADEIVQMLGSSDSASVEDIVNQLKEKYGAQDVITTTTTLDLDDARTNEIFDSFNKIFNEAGLGSKVVDALAELCTLQQNDPNYMLNKSGDDLARELLKKYQNQ